MAVPSKERRRDRETRAATLVSSACCILAAAASFATACTVISGVDDIKLRDPAAMNVQDASEAETKPDTSPDVRDVGVTDTADEMADVVSSSDSPPEGAAVDSLSESTIVDSPSDNALVCPADSGDCDGNASNGCETD